jgi:hypothetical protein
MGIVAIDLPLRHHGLPSAAPVSPGLPFRGLGGLVPTMSLRVSPTTCKTEQQKSGDGDGPPQSQNPQRVRDQRADNADDLRDTGGVLPAASIGH